MPKVILKRDINERVLYDHRLNWAAKGLMIRLLSDEQSMGETYFSDREWTDLHVLLAELEKAGYIRFTDKDENESDLFIL